MKRVKGIATSVRRIIRRSAGSVARKPMAYAQRSGWSETTSGNFVGSYRANGYSWRGKIRPSKKDGYELLIFDPPMDRIRKMKEGLCFGRREGLWYSVHHHGAENVSAAIIAVERVLERAVNPKTTTGLLSWLGGK